MKQLAVAISGILFVAFATGCITESSQYSVKPLHQPIETEYKDLEGDYIRSEILIYKKTRMRGTENVTLAVNKYQDGSKRLPRFIMRLNFTDWVFPDSLDVRVNGEVYRMEEDDKATNVIGGSNVTETYVYMIPPEMLERLKNPSEVAVQIYSDEIYEIPSEGLKAIEEHLRGVR